MTHRTVHLRAGEHQLDRTPQLTGRENAEDLRSVDNRLRTESTAEEGRADQHVFRRNTEILRVGVCTHAQCLVGHVEGKAITVPFGDHGVGLHGIVVLRRGVILRLGHTGCGREPRLDITGGGDGRRADPDRLGVVALAVVQAGAGQLFLIAWCEQPRTFGSGFKGFGHHKRNGLIDIANAVVL